MPGQARTPEAGAGRVAAQGRARRHALRLTDIALAIPPLVMALAVAYGRRRGQPLFDSRFHEPSYTKIDAQLVIGSALFGVGWGMSGICPGPAISLAAFLPENLWIFLLAMFVGSWLGNVGIKRLAAREAVA